MRKKLIEITLQEDDLNTIPEETTCDICWCIRILYIKIKSLFINKEKPIEIIVSELNTPCPSEYNYNIL